jgi:hypothetical protein
VVARSCEPHCDVSTTTGATIGEANIPQSGTPTVALGQTIGQVTAIMGAPKQIVDLGSKQSYKYPT